MLWEHTRFGKGQKGFPPEQFQLVWSEIWGKSWNYKEEQYDKTTEWEGIK